jgi:hypothetical protein
MRYEQLMISLCHKFGVLYSREGQTDELQIYNNGTHHAYLSLSLFLQRVFLMRADCSWTRHHAEHASPAFEEFLEFLGSKVALQGFTGYSGGLDTKSTQQACCSLFYVLPCPCERLLTPSRNAISRGDS